MDRILIIRFGSIGNTLVSIPAVRAVRKAYPASFIAMIVSPGIDSLLHDIPWINELIVYDMHGVHKNLFAYFGFIHGLRKRHFDTVLVVKRFLRSELIALLSGARRRIGFQTGGKSSFLTDYVPYVEGTNIVELNMSLLKPIGIHSTDYTLELGPENCPDNAAAQRIRTMMETHGMGGYAVIHPGGTTVKGAGLSMSSYANIMTRLTEEYRLSCCIIGDSSDAAKIQSLVRLTNNNPRITTAIGLPLKEITCLIRHAALFIGNDSGPCHIAEAVHTPGVIIYPPMRNLAEHIRKWKPAGNDYLAIIPPKACDTCNDYPCDEGTLLHCTEAIDIEPIFRYTEHILTKRHI